MMRQQMDGCRLLLAGNDQALTLIRLEVSRQSIDPALGCRVEGRLSRFCKPELLCQCMSKRLDAARANGEPMLSHRAGNRGRTLGHVEAVHSCLSQCGVRPTNLLTPHP